MEGVMKKRYLALLATGLFLVGAVGTAQAIPGTYTSLIGTDVNGKSIGGVGYFQAPDNSKYTKVYDEDGALIGYESTSFTGIYLGTFDGNTEPSLYSDAINTFLGYSPSLTVIKIDDEDYPENDSTPESVTKVVGDFDLTVTYNYNEEDESTSGTWDIAPNSLSFYAITGGPNFALYFMNPAEQGGDWTTENVTTGGGKPYPGISHFSASASGAPIPEPGTLLLFGTGLAGLAAVGRRRKN